MITREEAIKENNKRWNDERKIFDGLFNDLFSIPIKKIKIYGEGQKEQLCHSDKIIAGKQYLFITDGKVYLGSASKTWYGWTLYADGYSQQLDHIDMIFDIELPDFPSKPLGRVNVPKEIEDEYYDDDDDDEM